MCKINAAFFLFEEISCFNAVFGLAKTLKDRGANVTVIVKKGTNLPDYYLSYGLQATELDFDAFVSTDTNAMVRPVLSFSRIFTHSQSFISRAQVIASFVDDKAIDLCFLDNVRPDVNMVSSVLIGKGVPVILLSVNFASNFQTNYPPIFSSLVPKEGKNPHVFLRLVYLASWVLACCTEGRRDFYSLKKYFKRSAAKMLNAVKDLRYERELGRLSIDSTWGEWKRHPKLPTIVFGHRKLDWNVAASNPLRCYFSSSDIYRSGLPFDWPRFHKEKPIVYCSISTLVGLKIETKVDDCEGKKILYGERRGFSLTARYLNAVIDAFSLRADWQLILACGPFYECIKKRPLPKNVYVFGRVPQLTVLKRADLVICWGGAGTVRESVNLQVPMLIFPAWTDQYGNAARVVSKNVGLSGDIRKITAETVVSMVEKGLGDCSIKASLDAVRDDCDSDLELEQVLDFVSLHSGLSL